MQKKNNGLIVRLSHHMIKFSSYIPDITLNEEKRRR